MESLETKIERLPHELQKEVEDFVDFLTAKHRLRDADADAGDTPAVQPAADLAPFPLFSSGPESAPAEDSGIPIDPAPLPERELPPPRPLIFAEEHGTVSKDDWLTRNYLDYGALENEPEPQARAAKRAEPRDRQAGRPKTGPSPEILDWIE